MDWRYLLLSFDGRISRQPFWLAFAAVTAAELFCHMLAFRIEGERLGAIVDLVFIYPEYAVCAKRGHDRNIPTGWIGIFFAIDALLSFLVVSGLGGSIDEPNALFLIIAVPWLGFGFALLIDIGLRRGTPGPNRFGPDPLARRS